MTIAYLDCFSGIAGDMTIGALLDAGLSIENLRSELAKLGLPGYEIEHRKVERSGLSGTIFKVIQDRNDRHPRRLSDIQRIIHSSSLSPRVKQKSMKIFERLAEAEAKVHGTTPEQIHFHEIGAVDAIVDIVGAVIGFEQLGISEIVCSPINLGSGTVHTAHGRLPVPAPATAELLRSVPVYSSSIPHELATPTGAAIVSTLASMFGPMPQMRIKEIGYGAGGLDIPGQPNLLRIFIGEPIITYEEETAVVIETNIDDMNPQIYDHLIDRLMKAGALDVFIAPVIMKKSRPGILLSAITNKADVECVIETLFRETTSIGIRIHEVGRRKLNRRMVDVETSFGMVRVKVSSLGDEVITVTPEYEDCRKLAEEKQASLKNIIEEAKNRYFRNAEDSL